MHIDSVFEVLENNNYFKATSGEQNTSVSGFPVFRKFNGCGFLKDYQITTKRTYISMLSVFDVSYAQLHLNFRATWSPS